jgi:hypothetical protein
MPVVDSVKIFAVSSNAFDSTAEVPTKQGGHIEIKQRVGKVGQHI